MANLIRLRKTHHYGLGGFPHSLLHQDKVPDKIALWWRNKTR
ncbi:MULTISPECIES: hypothetical protein [Moorena]|nr:MULTISPECIES: hypothetical protein [Moorena]